MFISHLSQQDVRMRQGEQRRAAAGVQAGRLSLGRPGGLETGPGGHRESCLGQSLARVAGGGTGHQGGPPGPGGTLGMACGCLSAWSLACHAGVPAQGLPPAGGQRGGLPRNRPAWPRWPTAARWPQSSPQPGPRCPHRDPNRLSAPGGVGVIRSLCLLLW